MRVLLISAHYPPDLLSGATLLIERLATGLTELGVDVDVMAGRIDGVLADGTTAVEQRDGVTIHWLGTSERIHQDDDRNWQNPFAVDVVAELVRTRRPDVVHAQLLQTFGADLLVPIAEAGVPIVVTMHDFWWSCARLFLVDRDLRPCSLNGTTTTCACARSSAWRVERARALAQRLELADVVLAPGAPFAAALARHGRGTAPIEVDTNDVADEIALRGHLVPPIPSASNAATHFVYVGGDAAVKGRDVVLDAARQLRGHRGWRLSMYGASKPPWYRRPRRVTFQPAYAPADTMRVLADADVLVVPSVARESFSLAAREALLCGVPVITSACLGPEEVVVDGINGRVVPIGDVPALAAAMAELTHNPTLLARLREGARMNPPTRRRAGEHARALLDRYRSLIDAGRADDATT